MNLFSTDAYQRIVASHRLAKRLRPILEQPTGMSSAGFPYLRQSAWEKFRDTIPHTLALGLELLELVAHLEQAIKETTTSGTDDNENIGRACRVVRQVVYTAAITAPPNLWILRHMLGWFGRLGLIDRLLAGDALYPDSCEVLFEGSLTHLDPIELGTDLHFLLSLGVLEQYEDSFRIAGHPRVKQLLAHRHAPSSEDTSGRWRQLFCSEMLSANDQDTLMSFASGVRCRVDIDQNHWFPTTEEVDTGYRLVPIVLAMRAANLTSRLRQDQEIRPGDLNPNSPLCVAAALNVLACAGWVRRHGERYRVTVLGARGLARGPGPFGIIHTYHPYMSRGEEILRNGRGQSWVSRGENVGASQDANRKTFERANDAIDRFCADNNFEFNVFIEHAIGRGEATRQRFARSGDQRIRYVGADLEDAAIDAAIDEQQKGQLPQQMIFVRNADIGVPVILLDALKQQGIESNRAVMVVGNGFHEVRNQTDDDMVKVFRGYHDAGIILSFTEENALSIDDLRATAWNTYHASFKYVHEKSGQALRPAEPRQTIRLGRSMRAAWSQCAQDAGYVRVDQYCSRTRTVYPYTPRRGRNPSISVNHFLVPAPIATELGIIQTTRDNT